MSQTKEKKQASLLLWVQSEDQANTFTSSYVLLGGNEPKGTQALRKLRDHSVLRTMKTPLFTPAQPDEVLIGIPYKTLRLLVLQDSR